MLVEGVQYVIIATCDANGTEGSRLPNVVIDIDVDFRNPYGHLPGQLYGCVSTRVAGRRGGLRGLGEEAWGAARAGGRDAAWGAWGG